MLVYRVIRDVTKKECHWLDNDIKAGTIVFEYTGPTYGCISDMGTAFSFEYDKSPFFELPNDAVRFDLHASD